MTALRFTNLRNITSENFAELPELHLRQMARAATLGFGVEYTTAEQFLEQTGDGDLEDGSAELWDVVDAADDRVLYEAWVYLVDTCTVFPAGTDLDSGIGMSQWSFEVHAEPGTKEVSDALQAAFDTQRIQARDA